MKTLLWSTLSTAGLVILTPGIYYIQKFFKHKPKRHAKTKTASLKKTTIQGKRASLTRRRVRTHQRTAKRANFRLAQAKTRRNKHRRKTA